MDRLNLSQPLAIIVVGLPGSGKSAFANAFAATFGSAVVSRDKIRWTLFANHTYSENENTMVDQMADLLISELLRTKQTFVIDGGYNIKRNRDELIKNVQKSGYGILIVEVQTDNATTKDRAMHRSEKNPGDKYKQSLKLAQFNKFIDEYDAPVIGREALVVSGKHTAQTQLRSVLKKIVEMKNNPTPSGKNIAIKTEPKAASGKVFIQ